MIMIFFCFYFNKLFYWKSDESIFYSYSHSVIPHVFAKLSTHSWSQSENCICLYSYISMICNEFPNNVMSYPYFNIPRNK